MRGPGLSPFRLYLSPPLPPPPPPSPLSPHLPASLHILSSFLSLPLSSPPLPSQPPPSPPTPPPLPPPVMPIARPAASKARPPRHSAARKRPQPTRGGPPVPRVCLKASEQSGYFRFRTFRPPSRTRLTAVIFSEPLLLSHLGSAGRTGNVSSAAETLRLGPRGRGPHRRRRGLRAGARASAFRHGARAKRERAAPRGHHARKRRASRRPPRSRSAPAITTTAPRTPSANPIPISRAALRATTRARPTSSPIRATRRRWPPCSTGPAAPTRP